MSKNLSRILIFVLLVMVLLSQTAGATVLSTGIQNGNAWATSSGGVVTIGFRTNGTSTMDYIGATCIRLYNAAGTLVYTYWWSYYPNMLTSNASSYGSYVRYDGVSGTSYYAVVTLYAYRNGGWDTLTRTTNTVTA